VAKSHGLLAVEDCAQAFNGRDYAGSPAADVVMFSFGPIKTATALGGALLRVTDPALLARMREIQGTYPVQTDAKQRKRVQSAVGIKILSSPVVLGFVYRYYKKRGRNYEEELANHVRDVAPLKQKGGLRYQPSATLLWMMNRRMRQLSGGDLARRTAKGTRLASRIGDVAALPGQTARHHDYWLFAVVTDKPSELMEALRAEGFDAGGLPRSQTVNTPADRADLGPVLAKDMLDNVVVVPCYESMPDREIDREAEVIRQAVARSGSTAVRELARRMDTREQA
jgi:perosamine synthetase